MSELVTSELVDGVTVLRMRAGENRINPDLLDAMESALDAAENGPVVLAGEGKFFSNGFDLEWMSTAPDGQAATVVPRFCELAARLLAFPGYVVAALNGHTFAAGAMLALACDQRVMREDRGFFCLPEVDLGLFFSTGMTALITAKLSPATAHEAMVTGRRYPGPAAVEAGIVGEVAPADELVSVAVKRAAAVAGKPSASVGAIKTGIHQRAIDLLRAEAPGR